MFEWVKELISPNLYHPLDKYSKLEVIQYGTKIIICAHISAANDQQNSLHNTLKLNKFAVTLFL